VTIRELPLSHGQRALWFLHQLAPESPAYNIAFVGKIVSAVEPSALRQAFQALVDRHEGLRTSFMVADGQPIQRIAETIEVPFEEIDASAWTDARVHGALSTEIARPFSLARGPMIRVQLYSRGPGDAFLAVTFHHIVMDGWSLWVCLSELGALDRAAIENGPADLPAVATGVEHYVRWQSEMLSGAEGARQRRFWTERLHGEIPILDLPADKPRPMARTYRGASHKFVLSSELSDGLRRLAREARGTPQMAVLALFQILLQRYTGQGDFLVGYLSAGRSRRDFEALAAYLANPLALRAAVPPQASFRDVLTRTRNSLLDALDHQDYPFSVLVDELSPERDASRSPLFQVMFVFEKPQLLEREGAPAFVFGEPGARMTLGDLALESLPFSAQQEGQFDLTCMLVELDGRLAISFDYSTELFEAPTIERMGEHLTAIAAAAIANPNRPIAQLSILTQVEEAQIAAMNATRPPLPALCVHELFEVHARRHPDALAASYDGSRLSYAELDARANQLAHALQALGVGPGTAVALCVRRSLDLVVALLGVLKAGGAFVPLDPAYPFERLTFMLRDSRAPLLITEAALLDRLPPFDGRVLRMDGDAGWIASFSADPVASGPAPRDLAYIIYTSGSTGQPKGVLLEHRGLTNVALEQQRLFGVGPGSRVLQFASLSFDAAVFEFVMAFGSGGSLHLAPPEALLPGAPLLALLTREAINVVTLPPSALLALPPADLPALTTITVAGEACPAELVTRWAVGRDFFNLYGPTESTIWATAVRCTPSDRAPSIGVPIGNTEVYVLDPQLQRTPVGVAGELHIGGVGLARGYLNQPELTASRFIPNPFSDDPGARLYKTGDLVRLLPDGELGYVGRIDFQVKVRGFRIELGEIESVLAEHPDVAQAAAVVRHDVPGEGRLVAYVVPHAAATPSAATLKSFLKTRLPDFMVPSAVMLLEAFPLSPSGKINRRALPAPIETRGVDISVAPTQPVEQQIADIWKEVLHVDRVGIDDNFFDLGGSSLLIARVHAKLSETLPSTLTIVDMFKFPTVRALAASLAAATGAAVAAAAPAAAAPGDLIAGTARLRDQAARRGQPGITSIG
jgi:amino acid adenylation domain-containing protein